MRIKNSKLLFYGCGLLLMAGATFFMGLASVGYWQRQSSSHEGQILIHVSDQQPEGLMQHGNPESNENENKSTIKNGQFRGWKLRGARFSSVVIVNSDFSKADLREANFRKTDVRYSSFIDTNLLNGVFTRSRMYGSDFTGANLENAKFTGANLARSDFANSELKGADLSDSNLSDARLEYAHGLTYEQLMEAVISKYTTLPPNIEFKRAELMRNSKTRYESLRKRMSSRDSDRYFNEFDFIE